MLAAAAPAAAKRATFTYAPRTPQAGGVVRFTAPVRLCGHHRCRYVWERSSRLSGAKRVPIATGRRARVTFKSSGAVWVRLTVRRSRASTRHLSRRIKVAARPAPPETVAPPAPPGVASGSTLVPALPPVVCTTGASPATFASQFAALQPGQTLCLAAGAYGTWTGGAKPGPVTVAAAPGAAVSMRLSFTSASNVSVRNVTITDAQIAGSSHDITVGGSNFTGLLLIDTNTPNANVVLNGNRHVDLDADGLPARVTVTSRGVPSGVTVANSLFQGGDSDGVRPDADSVQVIGNEFADIVDKGANHADPIQFYGAKRAVIRGNYFHNSGGNISAYIMQADGGVGNVIEDNVFGAGRGVTYAITLYSDDGTIIRHNTMEPGTCDFNTPCGTLSLGNKAGDPVSRGTVIRDNVLAIIGGGGGTYTADHNLMTGQSKPLFTGPLNTYAGFRLAPGSPGRGAASDGLDVGIR
jgi:hypothetical protein